MTGQLPKPEEFGEVLTNEQKQAMLAGKARRGFRKPEEITEDAPSGDGKDAAVAMAEDAARANARAARHARGEPEPEEIIGGDLTMPDLADDPNDPPAEDPPADPAAAAAAAPPAPGEEEIRIGTKTFKNQKEAYAYAQEIEAQRIADSAFRQGIEAAQRGQPVNPPPPPAPPEDEKLPDHYYSDPARYLRERDQKTEERILKAVDNHQAQQERSRATMAQFYKDYPDLVGDEDVVDMVLRRDWETVKVLETKVGLKLVADKARGWLEEKTKKRMPSTVLPRVTTTASTGTRQTVTPKKPEEPALNFVSQSQNLKTPAGRAAAKKRLGLR